MPHSRKHNKTQQSHKANGMNTKQTIQNGMESKQNINIVIH